MEGTLTSGKKYATGTIKDTNGVLTVSGLSFRPKQIIMSMKYYDGNYSGSSVYYNYYNVYDEYQTGLIMPYVGIKTYSEKTSSSGQIHSSTTYRGYNNITITNDGFSVNPEGWSGQTFVWTAYE